MKLDRSTKKFSHGQEGARQCAEQAPDEGAGRRETEGDRSHKKPENGKGRLKSETAHIESIAAGVREVASKVKANKMRALHNRRVSLKRIAKSIGKVAAVTAAPMPTFYCKDQTLRDAMYKNADTQPKSPDWALKVVDAVYKRLSAQVLFILRGARGWVWPRAG